MHIETAENLLSNYAIDTLCHVLLPAQLRAAGEQAKAKHDGPRGDIAYATNQKDFADNEEVLAQVGPRLLLLL